MTALATHDADGVETTQVGRSWYSAAHASHAVEAIVAHAAAIGVAPNQMQIDDVIAATRKAFPDLDQPTLLDNAKDHHIEMLAIQALSYSELEIWSEAGGALSLLEARSAWLPWMPEAREKTETLRLTAEIEQQYEALRDRAVASRNVEPPSVSYLVGPDDANPSKPNISLFPMMDAARAAELIESMIEPGAKRAARHAIVRTLQAMPERALEVAAEARVRIKVLARDQLYNDASPALKRLGIDVDAWPAPPAGLFVVEERTMYVRSLSPMTIAHEFGHAVDCALGGGVYRSGLDPEYRQIFALSSAFVTPYSATGLDEHFAENLRAVASVNDANSPWPRATPERLQRVSPEAYDYMLRLFGHERDRARDRSDERIVEAGIPRARLPKAMELDICAAHAFEDASSRVAEAAAAPAGVSRDEKRTEFYKQLTDDMIRLIETGGLPAWQRFWEEQASRGLPRNGTTGIAYRGANTLVLGLKAAMRGWDDPRWMTVRQANEKGWRVRAGERATLIEVWKPQIRYTDAAGRSITPDEARDRLADPSRKGEVREKRYGFHRTFAVFNAHQVEVPIERDGEIIERIPLVKHVPYVAPERNWVPHERVEQIVEALGVRVIHASQERAYYSPSRDEIVLPMPAQFPSQSDYSDVKLHEAGHSTGHASRLKRDMSGFFGSPAYAREELRAELSSFFMAAEIGLPHNVERHAAYLKEWVTLLKSDPMEIQTASRDAQAIHDFLIERENEWLLQRSQEQQAERSGELAPAAASLIQAFERHGVEYAVIGSGAVALHAGDVPAGAMTLLVRSTPENEQRIVDAAVELGADAEEMHAELGRSVFEAGDFESREDARTPRPATIAGVDGVALHHRLYAVGWYDDLQDIERATLPSGEAVSVACVDDLILHARSFPYEQRNHQELELLVQLDVAQEIARSEDERDQIANIASALITDPAAPQRPRMDHTERRTAFIEKLRAAGDDKTKTWSLCVNEVRSLNASYDVTTVRRYMTEYRALVREQLGPDHAAIKHLRAFAADRREISEATKQTITARLRDLRPIDSELIVDTAADLLRSDRWQDRVAGVAIATGRRLPEIAAHGTFTIGPDGGLVFAGAVRGDADVAHVIPSLVEPTTIVDVVRALREQKPVDDRTPSQISSSYGTPVAAAVAEALGERYTATELRDLYATIAHAWHGTSEQSFREFSAAALGYHADDVTTSLGHIRFYVDGREIESCEDFERSRLELVAITRERLNRDDWSPEARARIESDLKTLQELTFDTRPSKDAPLISAFIPPRESRSMEAEPAGLPAKAFTTHSSSRTMLVQIDRGEEGHAVVESFTHPLEAAAAADRLNAELEVTPSQREALVAGSMFGFHVPGARPESQLNFNARSLVDEFKEHRDSVIAAVTHRQLVTFESEIRRGIVTPDDISKPVSRIVDIAEFSQYLTPTEASKLRSAAEEIVRSFGSAVAGVDALSIEPQPFVDALTKRLPEIYEDVHIQASPTAERAGEQRAFSPLLTPSTPNSLPDVYQRAIAFLQHHGVEFAVMGGSALAVRGSARPLSDLDVLVSLSPENRDRLLQLASDLGISRREATDRIERYMNDAAAIARRHAPEGQSADGAVATVPRDVTDMPFPLTLPGLTHVEMHVRLPGVGRYEDLAATDHVQLESGLVVPTVSINDLAANRAIYGRQAGRAAGDEAFIEGLVASQRAGRLAPPTAQRRDVAVLRGQLKQYADSLTLRGARIEAALAEMFERFDALERAGITQVEIQAGESVRRAFDRVLAEAPSLGVLSSTPEPTVWRGDRWFEHFGITTARMAARGYADFQYDDRYDHRTPQDDDGKYADFVVTAQDVERWPELAGASIAHVRYDLDGWIRAEAFTDAGESLLRSWDYDAADSIAEALARPAPEPTAEVALPVSRKTLTVEQKPRLANNMELTVGDSHFVAIPLALHMLADHPGSPSSWEVYLGERGSSDYADNLTGADPDHLHESVRYSELNRPEYSWQVSRLEELERRGVDAIVMRAGEDLAAAIAREAQEAGLDAEFIVVRAQLQENGTKILSRALITAPSLEAAQQQSQRDSDRDQIVESVRPRSALERNVEQIIAAGLGEVIALSKAELDSATAVERISSATIKELEAAKLDWQRLETLRVQLPANFSEFAHMAKTPLLGDDVHRRFALATVDQLYGKESTGRYVETEIATEAGRSERLDPRAARQRLLNAFDRSATRSAGNATSLTLADRVESAISALDGNDVAALRNVAWQEGLQAAARSELPATGRAAIDELIQRCHESSVETLQARAATLASLLDNAQGPAREALDAPIAKPSDLGPQVSAFISPAVAPEATQTRTIAQLHAEIDAYVAGLDHPGERFLSAVDELRRDLDTAERAGVSEIRFLPTDSFGDAYQRALASARGISPLVLPQHSRHADARATGVSQARQEDPHTMNHRLILIGDASPKSLDMKPTQAGGEIARLGLRQSKGFGDNRTTEFFDVTAFTNLSATVKEMVDNLQKGEQLRVECAVHKDSYEKDGAKHRTTELFVNDVSVITKEEAKEQRRNDWIAYGTIKEIGKVNEKGNFCSMTIDCERPGKDGKVFHDYFKVKALGEEKVKAVQELTVGQSYEYRGRFEREKNEDRQTHVAHYDPAMLLEAVGQDLGVRQALGIESAGKGAEIGQPEQEQKSPPSAQMDATITNTVGDPVAAASKILADRVIDRAELERGGTNFVEREKLQHVAMQGMVSGQSPDGTKLYMEIGRGDKLEFDVASFGENVPQIGKEYRVEPRQENGLEVATPVNEKTVERGQEQGQELGIS